MARLALRRPGYAGEVPRIPRYLVTMAVLANGSDRDRHCDQDMRIDESTDELSTQSIAPAMQSLAATT
jgi:hypothetical protein